MIGTRAAEAGMNTANALVMPGAKGSGRLQTSPPTGGITSPVEASMGSTDSRQLPDRCRLTLN